MCKHGVCHNPKHVILIHFWGVLAPGANFILDLSLLLGLFYQRVLGQ